MQAASEGVQVSNLPTARGQKGLSMSNLLHSPGGVSILVMFIDGRRDLSRSAGGQGQH